MALSPALRTLMKTTQNRYARTGDVAKLKEGKNRIRVLQPKAGEKFWAEIGVHWIKADIKGKPLAVVGCTTEVYGTACPVCTAIELAMKAAVDDESIALIKSWNRKKSILVNALIRTDDLENETPVVLELTPTTFTSMLSTIDEYADEDDDILDPTSGRDFVVERKGKGLDTEYVVMAAPKPSSVKKDVLGRCTDLYAFIDKQYFKGDELKALNAITNITGVSVAAGALTGPRGTALLTSAAGTVEGAEIEEKAEERIAEPPKTKPKAKAKPAAEPETVAETVAETSTADSDFDDDLDAELADLDNL